MVATGFITGGKVEKMKLDEVLAKINKQFGENTIGRVGDMKVLNIERVPSGSLYLDWALGGGWPLGRCVELYGHYSTGKSVVALKTVAEAQKLGKECAYIDCENAFDPRFASKLGIDVDKLVVSQASIGETTIDIVAELLSADVGVIVVDSVASMVPKAEFEEPMEQQFIALSARLMSKALRKLTALNKKTLIIFINQIRVSPTAYGNPEVTPGGKALGHYSAVRVELRRGSKDFILDTDNKKIGQLVKFKIVKNKSAVPFREGSFKFMYDGVIDRTDEIISLGLALKKIERAGSYYEVQGDKYQGREMLEATLRKNQELFKALEKEVLEGHEAQKNTTQKD